ncbi:hypothetical protein STFE110948_02180 [Streptobacillus felis]|uniref:translocation/assembly module TamB domain-containing protein n=1 Tax=Streptobacillus felis TaxID=1384509 RepID=UPI0008320DCB|nr:hypothetical protein [Streptobacillus felis]
MNKGLKRSLSVILPLSLIVVGAKEYVNTNAFESHLKILLNKVFKIKVDYSDLKLHGLSRIEIKDLRLKTQDDKEVIAVDLAKAKINLFTPSRISDVELYGGNVILERDEKGINLEKILPITKKTDYRRLSLINKVNFNDVTLRYIDNSFDKKIEKEFKDVDGYLYNSLQTSLDLEAIGKSDLDEELKIKIKLETEQKKNGFDLFSNREYSEEKNERIKFNFDFKNVNITNDLFQYVPINDMVSANNGKLNGKLEIVENMDRKLEFFGNLDIKDSDIWYKEYKDIIKKANANVKFNKYDIDLNGNAKVDGSDLDLGIKFNVDNNKLNLKTKIKNAYIETLKKYSLIEKMNLGNKSDKIDVDIDLGLSIKDKEVDFDKFDGSVNTKYLNSFGVDFNDLNLGFKLKEKNILNISGNNIGVTNKISEDLVVKGNANADFDLNLKNISGKGIFEFDNKSNFINLKKITGNVEVKENKDVLVDFKENKVNGNLKYVNENQNVILNLIPKSPINVIYKNNNLDIIPSIKDLTYSIKNNDILSGILDINAKSNDRKYFNTLNGKVNIGKGLYKVNASANTDEGNININGQTCKNLVHKYNVNAKNFDLIKFAKKIGVKNLDEVEGTRQDLSADIVAKNLKDSILISADVKKPINILYKDNEFGIKPKLRDVLYNYKDGNVKSGNIDLGVSGDGKFFDMANANIIINNGKYDINSVVNIKDGKLIVSGNTTKDLINSYNITGEKIDIFEIGKQLGYLNKDIEEKMPLNFNTKINGNLDNLRGNIDITSAYGGYIAEYENLKLKGTINNLKEFDMDFDLSMDELWIKYQRFLDVKSKVKIRKEDIFVDEFGNDKLKVEGKYNLKTENVELKSSLNAYNIYSTFGPDIDVLVNNMRLNVNGNINDLNGNISVDESPVLLNKKQISDFVMNGNIVNNKINLEKMKVRDYNISGEFDIKEKNYDVNVELKENNIEELVDINDLKLNVNSKLNIKGNFENTDIKGNLDIENLSYKEYKIPKIFLDINHKNANLFNLTKTGNLDINSFEIKDSKNNEVFKFKDSFDLSNLDIDYRVDKKEIDLEKITILNPKTYKGKLILDMILRHNKDETLASLNVKSDSLLLNNLKVTDVNLDVQGNENGINISEAYLEYENNPFLLDGYVSYPFNDYHFNLLANDFNLKFLEISDKIKESSGIANLNLYLKKNLVEGKINIDNFSLKTTDDIANLNKVNADIDLKNKTISINELRGNANGGNFSMLGKLDLPEIADDFLKSKNIKMGPIEVNTKIDNVNLKYAGNNLKVTSDIKIENNKIFGNVVLNNGNIVNISPFLNSNNKSKKSITNVNDYFTELKNQIIKNIINQHVLDVSLETEKDININIPSVVGLVKDIKGSAFGNARVAFDRSNLSIYSDLNVNKGEFVLNGHKFKIEEAVVKFVGNLDPSIEFKAFTNVNGDIIQVKITGTLNNRTIELSSEQGKDTNEILGIIAFDEEGGLLDIEKIKTSNIVGKALSSALNNLLFSTFTNKISSTLGINDFKIKANFDSKNSLEIKDIIDNTSTTFYINDQFFNVNNLYWNAELTVPFDLRTDSVKNKLKYNLWLNYLLKKGISTTVGIKTPIDISNSKTGNATFYTGLQYDNRYGSFVEIIDDLSSLFKKKKVLENKEKIENNVDEDTNK